VLADACVDDDGAPVELQHEALDRAAEPVAIELDEFGLQRVALGFERGNVESWQEGAQRQREVVIIDNDGDFDPTDREAHGASVLCLRLRS
jgi:hypothetical protein